MMLWIKKQKSSISFFFQNYSPPLQKYYMFFMFIVKQLENVGNKNSKEYLKLLVFPSLAMKCCYISLVCWLKLSFLKYRIMMNTIYNSNSLSCGLNFFPHAFQREPLTSNLESASSLMTLSLIFLWTEPQNRFMLAACQLQPLPWNYPNFKLKNQPRVQLLFILLILLGIIRGKTLRARRSQKRCLQQKESTKEYLWWHQAWLQKNWWVYPYVSP